MPDALTTATLATNLVASLVGVLIGARLWRHPANGDAHRATRLFALWWIAFGIDTALNTLPKLLWYAGITGAPLYVVITYAAVVAICVMFWGLVSYLAYLFSGSPRAFRYVTAFYALTLVFALSFIASLRPVGASAEGGIQYANEPSPLAALVWSLSLLLPPTIGSLAYGSLVVRVKHPFRRYRVALVSTSMFVWFGTAIFVNAPGASDAARAAGLAIGALALAGLMLAYFPPAALRRRLDVGDDPTLVHPVPSSIPDGALLPPVDRRARREALAARARELI